MSLVKIQGNASGTGTLTIAAPNTNSDYTLTLPDQTATLITDSAGVLNIGSGQVYKDASGNVGIGTTSPGYPLDVVQKTSDDSYALQLRGYTTGSDGTRTVNMRTVSGNAGDWANCRMDASSFIWRYQGATERMRIDSSGNLLVGTTSGSNNTIYKATGATILTVTSNQGADSIYVNAVGSTGANLGAAAALYVQKSTSSNRSINAGGTVNASGADYAEYMTKAGDFDVAKGDVVGINANGKLTNVFADAVSFCVKSTDPSYVGGDVWGAGLEGDEFEAARQAVDRIAFAGQVPVNVLDATPGQYIIPVDSNGAIIGQAVSTPTFEQYQIAVGKVIAIESDGRARIIVKVA